MNSLDRRAEWTKGRAEWLAAALKDRHPQASITAQHVDARKGPSYFSVLVTFESETAVATVFVRCRLDGSFAAIVTADTYDPATAALHHVANTAQDPIHRAGDVLAYLDLLLPGVLADVGLR